MPRTPRPTPAWSATWIAAVAAAAAGLFAVLAWGLQPWLTDRLDPGPARLLAAAAFGALFAAGAWLLARRRERSPLAAEAAEEEGAPAELLRALLAGSPAAVVALDPDGRVTLWSRAAERLFGWTEEEALGRLLPIAVGEEEQREFAELTGRVLSGETLREVEMRRRARDGAPIDLAVSAAPLQGAAGEVRGIVAFIVDLTARKRLESEFLQAQKLEAIGRLAGGIGHDFNNMLTAIGGYAELVRDVLRPGHPALEDVEEIMRAVRSATGLTRQLLTFSRRRVVEPRIVSLTDVVTGLEKILRMAVGERAVLRLFLDPLTPPVLIDPGQLEQVLMNLVVNAREAVPDGGRITLECRGVDLDEDYARRHLELEPGRYALLAVSDTGAGMTPEVAERIFEPFFTTKTEGTGLGLATVHGLIRQAGGSITVYSEPARGSSFKIYLPAAAHASPGATPARSTEPSSEPGTILVVEDDDGVRHLVTRVLESHGYATLESHSGEEALEVARGRASEIRLLITDVMLPGMSGPELADALRTEQPALEVLYSSGYTEAAIADHSLLSEGAHFIEKPFTPADLLGEVEGVLGEGQRV